jgi:hypothetical protein
MRRNIRRSANTNAEASTHGQKDHRPISWMAIQCDFIGREDYAQPPFQITTHCVRGDGVNGKPENDEPEGRFVQFEEVARVAAAVCLPKELLACTLFVAVGTSRVVEPAASFVAHVADRARTISVGPEEPANASSFTECHLGKAGEVLPDLLGVL